MARMRRMSSSELGIISGIDMYVSSEFHVFARSAKIGTPALFKQIMQPVNWNVKQSISVQQYLRLKVRESQRRKDIREHPDKFGMQNVECSDSKVMMK